METLRRETLETTLELPCYTLSPEHRFVAGSDSQQIHSPIALERRVEMNGPILVFVSPVAF